MIEDKEIKDLISADGYKEPPDNFTDHVMRKIITEQVRKEKQIIRPWFLVMMGLIFSGSLLSAFFVNPGKGNYGDIFFLTLNMKLTNILFSVSDFMAGLSFHWLTVSIIFSLLTILTILALEVNDSARHV